MSTEMLYVYLGELATLVEGSRVVLLRLLELGSPYEREWSGRLRSFVASVRGVVEFVGTERERCSRGVGEGLL